MLVPVGRGAREENFGANEMASARLGGNAHIAERWGKSGKAEEGDEAREAATAGPCAI